MLENQGILHLLAWPEDTNSPEEHSWVMSCRIPGKHTFTWFFSVDTNTCACFTHGQSWEGLLTRVCSNRLGGMELNLKRVSLDYI